MIEAVLVFSVLIVLLLALFISPFLLIILVPFFGIIGAVYFYFKNRNKEEKLEEDMKKKDSGNR